MADENSLIEAMRQIFVMRDNVVLGPGDDCAIVEFGAGSKDLLLAVDQLIGDVHYFQDSTPPEQAGSKLLKRNLSDIAAMGGKPLWALLTLAAQSVKEEWLLSFCHGLEETAKRYKVSIVGGDTAALLENGTAQVVATLTIVGEVAHDKAILRSGARAGDSVWVSGILGNTLASQHHLNFEPRLKLGQFLAEHELATAMMDLSDGLSQDARRLAQASQIKIILEQELLPCRQSGDYSGALHDGEDYELLFTVSPENEAKLLSLWPEGSAPFKIGTVSTYGNNHDNYLEIMLPDGSKSAVVERGYEHEIN